MVAPIKLVYTNNLFFNGTLVDLFPIIVESNNVYSSWLKRHLFWVISHDMITIDCKYKMEMWSGQAIIDIKINNKWKIKKVYLNIWKHIFKCLKITLNVFSLIKFDK